MKDQRCLHCKRVCHTQRRGLCQPCYEDPSVRLDYPRGTRVGARVWQPEDMEVLVKMFKGGSSDREIGEVLGRSRRSITWKRKELGLTLPWGRPPRDGKKRKRSRADIRVKRRGGD